MTAIDFGTSSAPGISSQVAAARVVNAYAEQLPSGAKSPLMLTACPGLTRWDSAGATYTGANRGMLSVVGRGLFAVLGNQLVQFTTAASHNQLGTIGGASLTGAAGGLGFVTMAANMKAEAPQLGIVTEDGLYYYVDTGTGAVTQYVGEDLPAPAAIDFLDRYFLFAIPDGRFMHSGIDDAGNIDPLAFAYAESRADGLKRVFAHRGAAVLLGDTSLEIWEDAGTEPFAFAPIRADIDIGCIAGASAARVPDGLMWVDQHGNVQHMSGSEPETVSTPALVRLIEQLSDAERAGLCGSSYAFSGHSFYALSSTRWTWEYDATTKLWHERQSRGRANWQVQTIAEHNNRFIAGTSSGGALFLIDPAAVDEDGEAFTVIAQGQYVHGFPAGGIVDAVCIDAVRGVGDSGGDADAQNPLLLLGWSIDGGKTWGGGRQLPLGGAGEYRKRIEARRLGKFDVDGIVFRLTCSAAVLRTIMTADVTGRPAK